MKGYIIKTNNWEEIVNETQLITFAKDCGSKEYKNASSAISSLKKEGIEVEEIETFGYRETIF